MQSEQPSGESSYLNLLRSILTTGTDRGDRTGTGTRALFGQQMRFDLREGFPLLTTKRLWWKGIVGELLWMLSGSTNVKPLQAQSIHIWDEWASESGDLGPIYGKQWRSWQGQDGDIIDQIATVIHGIRTDPEGRRHIVTAWNPGDLPEMRLPPCHCLFQFFVADDKLSCHLYQRSGDMFLGVPYNIASYSLLTHMVATVCGLGVGEFIHTIGDAHIYSNHRRQVVEQLSRRPRGFPDLRLPDEVVNISHFKRADMRLVGYDPHDPIEAKVAV